MCVSGGFSQSRSPIMIINMSLVYYCDCLAIEGDHVILKESLASLLSLLLEAIKCDSDCDTIR